MAKINSKALDPQRYACIKAEQRELEQQYSTHITMARLCPYCKKKFGKNAILNGGSYLGGATAKERNEQIGGHKA